ncbi:MAG: hypothetical protein ACJ8HU_11100 [Chthoniobacterales bacterium]|jgi:hypothetical protein
MKHLLALTLLVCLTSCATTSSKLATPGANWQTRTGQLAYRGPKMSLIGDVVVRTSPSGDMELTFSKAPALTLITVNQTADFGRVSGPLARGSWSGNPANAPHHLRGWFALREKILAGGSSVKVSSEGETFNLRF